MSGSFHLALRAISDDDERDLSETFHFTLTVIWFLNPHVRCA